MIVLDRLLVGGIRFVLDKLAAAAEAELNDDTSLREQLLAAQMRHELGELSDTEFAELESVLLARLREIRERQRQGTPDMKDARVTGVEIEFGGQDPDDR
ncbi:MAG: gas vesicle protein GvpG [Myxococcota bacterium]